MPQSQVTSSKIKFFFSNSVECDKNIFIFWLPTLKGSCQTACGYPCKIPFYYKNEKFEGCTKKDNGDEYWCATQINLTSTSKQCGPCNGLCPKDDNKDRYVLCKV